MNGGEVVESPATRFGELGACPISKRRHGHDQTWIVPDATTFMIDVLRKYITHTRNLSDPKFSKICDNQPKITNNIGKLPEFIFGSVFVA